MLEGNFSSKELPLTIMCGLTLVIRSLILLEGTVAGLLRHG